MISQSQPHILFESQKKVAWFIGYTISTDRIKNGCRLTRPTEISRHPSPRAPAQAIVRSKNGDAQHENNGSRHFVQERTSPNASSCPGSNGFPSEPSGTRETRQNQRGGLHNMPASLPSVNDIQPFPSQILNEIRAGHLIHRMSTIQVTRAPAKVKVRLGGRRRHERGTSPNGWSNAENNAAYLFRDFQAYYDPQSHGDHAKWIRFTLISLVIHERNGLTAHFFRCSVKLASCCGDVVAPWTCPWAVGPRTVLQLIYICVF